MTQIFSNDGLGLANSSINQLGTYGPKGRAALGQGGESVYVNAANGNLVLRQDDGFLASTGLGLELIQSYNSLGESGQNWSFNVQTRLIIKGAPNCLGSEVLRLDEDGHSSRFIFDEIKGGYVAEQGGTASLSFANNQWLYREGANSSSAVYDAKGQLIKLSDRDGHQLQFIYSQERLERIIDNSGQQTIEWYFEQGLLRDIFTRSAGEQVHHLHYDYDDQQRLRKVSRDLGEGKTYWLTYEYQGDSNRISTIQQSDGSYLFIDYDSEGRVKLIDEGENRCTSYEYLPGRTLVTAKENETWAYLYDERGRLSGIDSPSNKPLRYDYQGNYLSAVHQGDLHWFFSYNEAGDCVRIEEPSGQVTSRIFNKDHLLLNESSFTVFDGNHQPAQPKVKRFVYDESGHLRFQIASDGTVTEYRYNQEGQCQSSRIYLQSGYDLGQLTGEQILSLEVMQGWVSLQNPQLVSLKDYHYDWRGLLDSELNYSEINDQGEGVLNPNTLVNRFHYDAAGRLLEKSERNNSTTYLYDDLGRLLYRRDSQQHGERFDYDDLNQCIIETDAKGGQLIRHYDHGGLLVSNQYIGPTQQDYGTSHYRYDSAGRLQEKVSADGQATYYFYDSDGRLKAECEPGGRLSEYCYDALGRLVKRIHYQEKLNTTGWHDTLPAWSELGVKSSAKDRSEQTIYNSYNQIAFEINAEGGVLAFEYNALGQVTKKTAHANRLSNFQQLSFREIAILYSSEDRSYFYFYDSEGRLLAEVNGEGGASAYRYDRQGNVLETIRYANRLLLPPAAEWSAPQISAKDIHTFSLYNPAGLKIADIDPLGYTTTYEYNGRGLLSKKCSFSTAIQKAIFTRINATTTLDDLELQEGSNDQLSLYDYDELGQLIEQQDQNGLITRYRYDEKGLVLEKTLFDVKTQEQRQDTFRYDALGRVSQSLDALGSAKLLAHPQLSSEEVEAIWREHGLCYDYDLAGRLISQTNALQQTTRYFYDEAGLLIYTINADGEVNEQQYNAFKQVETSYRYAKALKTRLDNLTTRDIANTLLELKDEAADEKTVYEYNSLGLLINKTKGSKGQLTTSYTSFGEIEETRQFIDAGHQLINRYSYDHSGLVSRQIEDVDGLQREKTSAYDAFGRLVQTTDGRGGVMNYILTLRGEQFVIEDQARNKRITTYDAFGRILAETDYTASKKINIYSYDDKNNTLRLTHPNESIQVETRFNAFGDKLSLIDGNGNTTSYHYDEKGRLKMVESPESGSKAYSYDAAGNLEFEYDNLGHRIRYHYDASGRVLLKTIDPDGLALRTSYRYDGIGRQLEVIEANGLHKQFSYDERGNLIQTRIDPEGLNLISHFAYDDRDLLIRQVEFDATTGKEKLTSYEWDNLGRRTAVCVDPEGLNLKTSYAYDANDNLISQTDAKNQTDYFIYDAKNQCRFQIDARGVVTEHSFDLNGNEFQTIVYANRLHIGRHYAEVELAALVQASDTDHYTFRDFDNLGRLLASFDSLGYASAYSYDANSNLLKVSRYAQAIPLAELRSGSRRLPQVEGLRTQHFAYDGLNRLVYQIDEARVTRFDYDSSGQLSAKTSYAIGLSLADNHYSLENLRKVVQPSPEKDQYTAYAYDQAGRLSHKASADGAVSAYSYDGLGRQTSSLLYANRLDQASLRQENWQNLLISSEQDRLTRFVFDLAGRETYRISSEGRVLQRRYDALGNVVAEIAHDLRLDLKALSSEELDQLLAMDAGVRETDYVYDLAGRLELKTDAEQQQTSYSYDKNNNVTARREANSALWTYSYDEANQLIETQSPSIELSSQASAWAKQVRAIVTLNIYDSFGNIIETIHDAEGVKQKINYVYDADNRKIQTIYPEVQVNTATNQASADRQEELRTLSENYLYNAFGELIASSDRAGNWRYKAYDSKGNLAYSLDAQGGLTGYSYDHFGNLTAKTAYAELYSIADHPDFSVETIKYACKTDKQDRTETYSYDLENRLIETRKPLVNSFNANTDRYEKLNPIEHKTYNAFGELVQTAVKLNETDWAKTTYYYDRDGLKIACLDAELYLSRYSYNHFGELVDEVQYANRATSWNSERVEIPVADSKDRHAVFSYDNLGQLKTKTLKNVRYEQLIADSNRYESLSGDLTTYFTYDARGNLTSTTDPLGFSAYCYYDALGQLIAKVGPQTQAGRAATSYSYDGLGQLVEIIRYEQGAQEADLEHYLVQASGNDQSNRTVYDQQGKASTTIDALGHETFYSYDAKGQLQRSWELISQADGSKRLVDKRYSFDKEGHLLQTASFKNDGQLHSEDSVYNIFGELIGKGLNGKLSTHLEYDKLGRVWRSNTAGYYQIFLYDLTDRATQTLSASNAFSPDHGYQGIDLSHKNFDDTERFDQDALRFVLQRQNNGYDNLGRCLQQTKEFALTHDNNGPEIRRISQTETVDRWGNVLSHTNANGYETDYEYNAFNQRIKQELPEVLLLNEQFQQCSQRPTLYYAYDALGRAIALIDAKGHRQAKLLDAEGRVLGEVDAEGNKRIKTYDLFGQLRSSQNELGGLTTYVYDKANRLISLYTPTSRQSYAYDEGGKLLVQRDALERATVFGYDNLGNQTEKIDGNGRRTIYGYDEAGNKNFEQDANGQSQSWNYDEQGRLRSHRDLGHHETSYDYNNNGLLLEETSTAGKNLSYRYEADGQLWSFIDHSHNEVSYYSYDSEGNIRSKSIGRATQGRDQGWKPEHDVYAYDALGRLVSVKRSESEDQDNRFPDKDHQLLSVNYSYDAAGNIVRTQAEANYNGYQRVQSDDYFSYDANNRMLVNKGSLVNGELVINSPQSSRLDYDAAGNLKDAFILENGELQHYSYSYNKDSQLQESFKNEAKLKALVRDDLGRVKTEYLYDLYGNASDRTEMTYEGDLLKTQTKYSANSTEKNEYSYDEAGNLKTLVSLLVKNNLILQGSHVYDYELWDSYLQSRDVAAMSVNGGLPTTGENRRLYDANGQLYQALDQQVDAQGHSNNANYKVSTLEGIRSRIDDKGERKYLTLAGKTIGDLQLDLHGTQHLNIYGGFSPTGKLQNQGLQRGTLISGGLFPFEAPMGFFTGRNEAAANEAENILTNTPQDITGSYTIQSGDSLESIALQVYGDSSFWYLIADANGISDRNDLSQSSNGKRLIIPAVAARQHQNSGTYPLLSSTELLGDLSTTIPLPDSLSRNLVSHPRRHHSLFKQIVVAAISVVATVIAAAACAALGGALLSLSGGLGQILHLGMQVLAGQVLGTAGSMAAGFTAGVVGSLAGQSLGKALGLQEKIDFRSSLITGLSSAVSAGVLKGLGSSLMQKLDNISPLGFSLSSAAEMMEQDAIGQGISLALQNHQHFNWVELGTRGAVSALTGSKSLNQSLSSHLGEGGSAFVNSELTALATNGIQATLTGSHFDATQILTENLGSALGTGFLSAQAAAVERETLLNNLPAEEALYCPIPTSEEDNFSPIPEGSYERFHQERAQRERFAAIKERANEIWNDYGDEIINYGPKLLGIWGKGSAYEELEGNTMGQALMNGLKKGTLDMLKSGLKQTHIPEVIDKAIELAKELPQQAEEVLQKIKDLPNKGERVEGAMQMLGGLLGMTSSTGLIGTGPGSAIGIPLWLNSLDNVLAGAKTIYTGIPTNTQTLELLRHTPLNEQQARFTDAGLAFMSAPAAVAGKYGLKFLNYAGKTFHAGREQAVLKVIHSQETLKDPVFRSVIKQGALGVASGTYGSFVAGGKSTDGIDMVVSGFLGGIIAMGGMRRRGFLGMLKLDNIFMSTVASNGLGQVVSKLRDPHNYHWNFSSMAFSLAGAGIAKRVSGTINVPTVKTMYETMHISSFNAMGTNLGERKGW